MVKNHFFQKEAFRVKSKNLQETINFSLNKEQRRKEAGTGHTL